MTSVTSLNLGQIAQPDVQFQQDASAARGADRPGAAVISNDGHELQVLGSDQLRGMMQIFQKLSDKSRAISARSGSPSDPECEAMSEEELAAFKQHYAKYFSEKDKSRQG